MLVERMAAVLCSWLVTYFVHSTLILGVAWAVTGKLRSRFDRVAEQIWRAALVLPFVTSLAQHLPVSLGEFSGATVVAIGYTPQPLTVSMVPAALWIGVTLTWIFGALLLLGQLYFCHRQLRRQVSCRTWLQGNRAHVVADLTGEAGVVISVIPNLEVPLALAGEICLPAWLVDRMSDAELRAVVAHELAHVRRRDAFWRPAISALARVGFFQPFNWVAAARLRELSECICDEDAVAATRSPLHLAAALEVVARRAKRQRVQLALAPSLGAPVSLTLKRVTRILADHAASPPRRFELGPAQRTAAVIVAAALAIVVAPRLSVPAIAFMRYTINAEDPVGRFTVTVEKGSVVGATIGGRALAPAQIRQRGRVLELIDNAGVLSLRMMPDGGISWNGRKPNLSHK